jgi:hypothetical protein
MTQLRPPFQSSSSNALEAIGPAALEPMRSHLQDVDMAREIYLSSTPKCFLKDFSAASLPRWMSFWLASLS